MNIKKPLYIQQPPFRYCGQCQIKVITEFFANQHDNIISRERERDLNIFWIIVQIFGANERVLWDHQRYLRL